MPTNRIQFQPGLSLAEYYRRYGSDAQCASVLQDIRWPGGFICPDCGNRDAVSFERGRRHYWQCCHCRKQTSLTSGTLFDASKLPLTVWFLAMYLLSQSKTGVSALHLSRSLGVSYRTAWLVKHKLMQVMFAEEQDRQLSGIVQIDDAFLGGARTGGKRGRGSENKIPFVAAVQTTDTGKALLTRLDVVPNWKLASMAAWAHTALKPATHVVSDGLSTFVAVTAAGVTHEAIVHGTGKQSAQHPRFLAVNTLLGNLKTWLAATFKGFKACFYAPRYLAEFQYRFNRRFDLRQIMLSLLGDCTKSPPVTQTCLRVSMLAELRA